MKIEKDLVIEKIIDWWEDMIMWGEYDHALIMYGDIEELLTDIRRIKENWKAKKTKNFPKRRLND